MELSDYIKFANENPYCAIATTEVDQPRVRTFKLWFAEESGFYFAGLQPKRIYDQLSANPRVEVCFFHGSDNPGEVKQMRITGAIEFNDDTALKKRLLEDRAMYKNFGTDDPEDPTYYSFRIAHGEARFWTFADILKEGSVEVLTF